MKISLNGAGAVRGKKRFPGITTDKIFERGSSCSISIFTESFASVSKIFFLGEGLGTRL